jgi:glutamate--cysteine ligase
VSWSAWQGFGEAWKRTDLNGPPFLTLFLPSSFGTEHEKLGYYTAAPHARLSYDTISTLLTSLCQRFGWEPVTESGRIIGATHSDGDGVQSVSLEPGGQLELSGAPLDTLHKTCAEANSHLYQMKACAADVGVSFLDLGFDPKWDIPSIPRMPKDRYRIMADYMPRVGTMGLDMMFRSCTIQVNLDFDSEADMVTKFRVGLALQPIATALFANSPFRNGAPSGYKSWRSHVWTDVDNDRCGILPFVFEPGFGFERYADYALDVPMYFVYGSNGYADATQSRITFRDFLEGRNPVAPGRRPTIKDWETHLTTIFPEVRLKRFLEMRGADGGPWKEICALPAFWVGLLYDADSLAAAAALVADWTPDEHAALRAGVPVHALDTPFRGGTVGDVARTVVDLAEAGLARRGQDEARFLAPLRTIADTGVTRADRLLALYNGEWKGSVDPVYSSEFTY